VGTTETLKLKVKWQMTRLLLLAQSQLRSQELDDCLLLLAASSFLLAALQKL
jgi:hypothetical protein